MDEKKYAAASYIINFYQSVDELTKIYATYSNVILELINRIGKENLKEQINQASMDDTEKQVLMNTLANVRYWIHKVWIQYKSIIGSINKEDEQNLQETYDKIKNDFVIELQDFEKLTEGLNKFLLQEIVDKLLQNSDQYIQELYKNEPANPAIPNTNNSYA